MVTKIITNIYDANGNLTEDIFADADLLTRRVTTFRNYNLLYIGNQLKLIKNNESELLASLNSAGSVDSWAQLMNNIGQIRNGIS